MLTASRLSGLLMGTGSCDGGKITCAMSVVCPLWPVGNLPESEELFLRRREEMGKKKREDEKTRRRKKIKTGGRHLQKKPVSVPLEF